MLEVSFDPFLFTQDALELDLGPQFDPRGEVFQKRDGWIKLMSYFIHILREGSH